MQAIICLIVPLSPTHYWWFVLTIDRGSFKPCIHLSHMYMAHNHFLQGSLGNVLPKGRASWPALELLTDLQQPSPRQMTVPADPYNHSDHRPEGARADDVGPVLVGIHPTMEGLALHLASQAHAARASSTVALYKKPWKDFLVWVAQLNIQMDDIYETRPEMVRPHKWTSGRVSAASVAMSYHFFLAGRPSFTEHPACNCVREMSKRALQGKTRTQRRERMHPEHVRMLAQLLTGPNA